MGLYLRPLMRLLVACLSAILLGFVVSPVAQGAIGFALGPGSPFGQPGSAGAGVVTGDFNRDGHEDVVSVDGGSPSSVVFYPGDGSGRLGAPRSSPEGGKG